MTTMPSLAPPRDIVLPSVEERRFGATSVLAARLPTVPLVQVRVRLATPGGAPSALLAACLLDASRDGTTLRRRLESLAATSEVQADPDGVVLTIAAQADRAADVLDIASSLQLAEPAAEDIVTGERARLSATTQTVMSDAGEAARRTALALAYGADHPYAERLPTADALAAVDRSALSAALASSVLTSLVVVGDVDPTLAIDAARVPQRGGATGQPAAVGASAVAGAQLVERPGSVQTALRTVVGAPNLGDADRAAAEVLDRVLGNGHCSVLSRVLREEHGYGYHPASALVTRRAAAQLELHVDVAIEVTGAALSVLEAELAALASEPVAQEWLEIGRRGAIAGLGRRLDGQAFLAGLLQELAEAGLSPEYLPEHLKELHAVTAQDVQTLAGRLVDVDRMASVLVTDRAALRGQPSSRLLDSAL